MDTWLGRVVKSGISSFFITLFMAIVFAPLWALLLAPRAGLALAPVVCSEGEMSYSTVQTLGSDGLNTKTTFYCDTGAGPAEIPYSRLFLPPLVVHIAFFFLLVWPFLYAINYWRNRPVLPKMGRPWPQESATWTTPTAPQSQTFTTTSSSYVIDGRQYNSAADMPADVRRQFDQAMAALPDKDGDGIPDILQGNLGGFEFEMMDTSQTAEKRLQALQQLYEKKLITEAEYQTKRNEILRQL